MLRETDEMVKKFELEYGAYVEPHQEPEYWTVTVWMPKPEHPNPEQAKLRANLRAKRYITTGESKGWVMVVRNPVSQNTYSIEQWQQNFKSFDEFVRAVLDTSVKSKDEVLDECSVETCA